MTFYASSCAARQYVAVSTVGDATHAASLFFDIIRPNRQPRHRLPLAREAIFIGSIMVWQ
jgi:hypothetical protein